AYCRHGGRQKRPSRVEILANNDFQGIQASISSPHRNKVGGNISHYLHQWKIITSDKWSGCWTLCLPVTPWRLCRNLQIILRSRTSTSSSLTET
ncbi:hypothetical protein NDU88_003002, partial [Pleurodeles waltl]